MDTGVKRVPIDRTLFIDPGLTGTGWAFYAQRHGAPCSGVLKVLNPKAEWTTRAYDIAGQVLLVAVVSCKGIKNIGMEFPTLWGASSKSQTAASQGDLFKLSFLCGAIHMAASLNNINVYLFSPQEWKGQLPKDCVIRRIQRQFMGMRVPKDHEADAIGMGLAAQGLL
jgi:hypothetical protein